MRIMFMYEECLMPRRGFGDVR